MTIQINNYTELLEFIKRKDINSKQAIEIVCKALSVVVVFEMHKEDIIKTTEYYVKKFCQNNSDRRPMFLNQINLDFDIRDIYNFKRM
jgi:hypothetical protein